MEIELFPHNELAHKKLVEYLVDHQFASIAHATGTGKSFILLKYMYENRDKRILYLSPTYAINEQLVNNHMKDLGISIDNFKCLDTMIYRNILKLDMDALAQKYDIIILDEYHRCGAEKSMIKILKLKDLLLTKYPDKKLIGLTATNIRYLDNSKDMNKIIFDGNVASKLSLADAILQGILPIFEYVISYDDVLIDLELINKRINKYLLYAELDSNIKSKINILKELVENNIIDSSNLNNYVKKNGKYLVFSTDIKSIKKDKKVIKRILKDTRYNEYEINCGNSKEKNSDILNQFRKVSKNITSVLYSINILNEGVHVKDIDAIFMLRTTTSPIIYLQELGRLLSFSRRKDKVVVFDFKNNIGRNKVVYQIYEEVRERAKELLITDPDNKERYERILKEFKIIENSQIFKLLDEIKEETSIDKLINMRLNYAINVLKSDDNCFKYQAYIDLFHYQKYITLTQFKEIEKLDIYKPSIFKLSSEQFEEYLGKYKNIKEKMIPKYIESYNLVREFYKNNYRLPSITSNDLEEKKLATRFLKDYYILSNSKKNNIMNLCDDSLSFIEILCYNEDCYIDYYDEDPKDIYSQIDLLLNNKIYIPKNIVYLLESINTSESNKYIEMIISSDYISNLEFIKSNDFVDIIDKEHDNEILESEYGFESEILFREKSNEVISTCLNEFNNIKDKEKYILSLYKELLEYINNNYCLPKYETKVNVLFYKFIVFKKYLIEYNYYDSIIEFEKIKCEEYLQLKKQDIMDKIKVFMEQNNGGLPILNVSKEENILFHQYNNIIKYFDEGDKIKLQEISKQFDVNRRKVVYAYVNFIKKNGRRPSEYINDEEKKLVNEFNRVYDLLDEQEIMMIQKSESKLKRYNESKQLYLKMINKGD